MSTAQVRACVEPAWGAEIVTVRGDRFLVGERVIVPHGINSYPLLQHVGEGRMDAVRDILGQAVALGRPLVRTNAFMDGGDNPARLREDDASIREQGLVALDSLLAEASAFGVRLLLTLTNNWEDFGGAPAIVRAIAGGEVLPKDAFWSDPRALALQSEFVRTLVARTNTLTLVKYAQDPTVFAWELANEPRCTERAYCGPSTLTDWARAMSSAVRQAGARQPVAWGGSGHRGRYGEDLEALARDAAVDVLTVHVYPRPSALRFSRASRIAAAVREGTVTLSDRFELARRYGMPLLIEEIGYRPPDGAAERDDERAQVLRQLLALAHEAQVATLPWMIGEAGRADYDGYLIRPDDARTVEVLACRP